ncbi:hypothetical protein [Aliiroseovarius subalbicans]|uniref:hypothetical protein n=1 Tax=Aliiroseovarius subalbicans TaxID=2925840 RepID=UPI001F57F6DE|nr:hypothetical protein [Aliiroseovarius subalbicans]MCI2400825.1 hypothetical protein [Aliiroseovarius subalbicans]
MTWFPKALEDHHASLADRFSDLASERGSFPVFAIEHDLDQRALSELKAALALGIEHDPQLKGAQWAWGYLPLLVAAAETGYRYRGTGTDFWPLLSRELTVETGGEFRAEITRLFELGAKNFRLFRPGESPWERHFPLIAWPIGNALVPLEIQPQVTDALRRAIRAGISFEDTEGIIEYLKKLAAGHASRRFEHWIRNADVALEVMRRLLLPDSEGWMSAGILHRIDKDVRKDARSFRAISEARHNSTRRIARPKEIPSSRFMVSLSDSLPTELAIRGPVLSASLREEVIAGLRIQGDRIRATGSEHSILLRSFLAGGEIALGPFGILPESPLYRGDTFLRPQQETADILLENLQPAEASFFLVEPEGHTATAVVPGDALPVGAAVIHWIRTDQTGSPEFRRLETVSDAEYLRRHGFTLLSKRPALRVLGIPMPGVTPSYSAQFPILVSARNHDSTPFLDGEKHPANWLELRGKKWAAFQPSPGEHTLSSPELEDGDSILIEVVEPPDIEPASISIQPDKATLRDLELGRLEIKISSPIALEQVPVCLRILSGDQQISMAEDTVDRLPHIIAGGSPLLRRLQTQMLEHQAPLSSVRLDVEVQGLRPASTLISPSRLDLHYDRASGLWLDKSSENRTFSTLIATPDSPLPHANAADDGDLKLLLPASPRHQTLGSGVVVSDNRHLSFAQLAGEKVNVPILLREADSRDGYVGLTDVARATLAWQLAEADDLISNWRRFSVLDHLESAVIGLLCGAQWQKTEAGIDLSILSQHGALFRCAESVGLLAGEDLPRIEINSDWMFFRDRLIDRFRVVVTTITEAVHHWDEEMGGELDLAVIDAYEDLRLHLEKNGREAFEEVDMARPAEDWLRALEQAQEMPLLPMFRRLILPDSRWISLTSAPYDEFTENDLVDLLDECHVDASRRPGQRWIGRAELRALVQFWLSPEATIYEEDWPRLLSKALSDVRTARAVRYTALRYKLARLEMRDGVTV